MNGKCSRIKGSCYYVGNIACDISGVSTKAPYEAPALQGRHARKGIAGFVMHTFVPLISLSAAFLGSALPNDVADSDEGPDEDSDP